MRMFKIVVFFLFFVPVTLVANPWNSNMAKKLPVLLCAENRAALPQKAVSKLEIKIRNVQSKFGLEDKEVALSAPSIAVNSSHRDKFYICVTVSKK